MKLDTAASQAGLGASPEHRGRAMSDTARQQGATQLQIRQAPRNAIFVWCGNVTNYPRRMAKWLGRTDLVILTPRQLSDERLREAKSAVIVDHATILPVEILDLVDKHNAAAGRGS